MLFQDPVITIVITHFKREKSHWWTLRSALEQDIDSFNLVVGCDPEVLDSVIKYTNEFRFTEEGCTLSRVQLVDDKEHLDEDSYLAALKACSDTPLYFVLEAGMMLSGPEALSATLEGADRAEAGEMLSAEKLGSFLQPYSTGIAMRSGLNSPIPEDLKKSIFSFRDYWFKRSRLNNLLDNLMWIAFFLMLTSFLQTIHADCLKAPLLISRGLSYIAIGVFGLRIAAKIVVTAFDKYIVFRRARRAGK